jgi:hypothetical protein
MPVQITTEETDELRRLFHELWTRDVGTEGYDNEKWKRIVFLLQKKDIWI